MPLPVVEHLAGQLGVEDPSVVKRYTERRQTLYDHAWEIRDAYGYHPYEDADGAGGSGRSCTVGRGRTPRGRWRCYQAVGWLRRHRVLLPGVTVLARQVSEARKVAERRLHATVAKAARRADPALPGDLVATPEGRRYSELERLRRPPTRTTGTAFAPRAGAGGRDLRVPARTAEAVADPGSSTSTSITCGPTPSPRRMPRSSPPRPRCPSSGSGARG